LNSNALLYAVRDAVTSGILLTAEMRQGNGVMSKARLQVVEKESTKTGLSEKAFKSVFGVAPRQQQTSKFTTTVLKDKVDATQLWNLNAESFRLTKDHPAYDMLITTTNSIANVNASDFFACPASAMKCVNSESVCDVVPSLSLSLRKFEPQPTIDSMNALYPVPVAQTALVYAFFCPGILQPSSSTPTDGGGSMRVTLAQQQQSEIPSATSSVQIKSDFSMLQSSASWTCVRANLHSDNVLTLSTSPSLPHINDPLSLIWEAYNGHIVRNRCALFHISTAFAIVPTRFIWAGSGAIDIIVAEGVLTLFLCTTAAEKMIFLKALLDAAARPVGKTTHAVTIPSSVTGGLRCRLQITSIIESSSFPRSSSLILSGLLNKRGAIRSAFRERLFKLQYRDEKLSWLPSLLRNSDHLSTATSRAIVLSYYKQGKMRGEICIANSNNEGLVHELRLLKSPTPLEVTAAPTSAIAKALFGAGSDTKDYVFKVITDSRTWIFATKSGADASSWLAALSIGLRSRNATLLASLPDDAS
jgi:hypothetical protein